MIVFLEKVNQSNLRKYFHLKKYNKAHKGVFKKKT